MRDRVILHCDLNNFFASVSLLSNPTLKNLPVAVCGDKENRHGIVLAKNDIAKKFNVKTAEAIFEAKRKCPDLAILPPLMDEYKRYSELARKIYSRYTDMIESFGIDECWLDVTGSTLIFGDGSEIANKIRKDIKTELGITVSVGVSFNKIFAKLGSDMKKPDAVTVITKDGFKDKIWTLPVSDMLFAGRHTAEKLRAVGVCTIGDLAVCDSALLNRLLGKNGEELKRYALGEDNSPVVTPTLDSKPKSIGKSITSAKDFTSFDEVWSVFLSLSQSVSDSLHRHGLYASGVQVHIRTAALKVKEFSRTYPESTDSAYAIASRGAEILKENYDFKEPLRSVGIRAISLKDLRTAVQQDIFGASEKLETEEKIEASIYELRKKFGDSSIRRASAAK